MSLRSISFLFVLFAIATMQLIGASNAAAAGRYIVVLHDGASPVEAARRHGAAPEFVYRHALRGYAATLSDAQLAKLQRDPAVRFVSEDRVITLGKPGGGGSTTPQVQKVPTGITRIGQAASRYDGTATGDLGATTIDVAVIDTGIDRTHPDLNVVGGVNCSSGSSFNDGNGHGTHVAGTIGARDNDFGVVGVAPGVRLHAVRVLNNAGSGSWSSVACGLDWVAGNPTIDVANLSLGGAGTQDGPCGTTADALHLAVCRVVNSAVNDVNVFVAAGNDGLDATGFTPAAYDEVFTVSAWADFNGAETGTLAGTPCRADEEETFANFSNWGAPVDLAAPGVCILSTWKGGSYNTVSGTSMATPHVAGAAALYRSLTGAGADDTRTSILTNRTTPNPWVGDLDATAEGLLSVAGW